MSSTLDTVWHTLTGTPQPKALDTISSMRALKLVNELHDVGLEGIELPRIVVFGMQSSGKSSLLNAITGLDLMPTGGEMVTRAPLEI